MAATLKHIVIQDVYSGTQLILVYNYIIYYNIYSRCLKDSSHPRGSADGFLPRMSVKGSK